MESFKAYIILIILLISWKISLEQSVIINKSVKNISDVVLYQKDSINNTNLLITEIAKSIPKKIEFTQFSYSFDLISRVLKTFENNYVLSVDADNFIGSGDVTYKGFNISDVLIPTKISFNVSCYSNNIPEINNVKVEYNKLIFGYNKIFEKSFVDSVKSAVYNTTIDNLLIQYDSISINRFKEKINLIDKYYLTEFEIQTLSQKLNEINYNDINMIVLNDIHLTDIEKDVDKMFNDDYPANLKLSDYDPIKYIDNYNLLSEKTSKSRTELNKYLAVLDKIYCDKGVSFLNENKIKEATHYFNKAIEYNNYYAPAYYWLAKIDYMHDSIYKAALILSNVLNNMNPDPDIYRNIYYLSDSLINRFTINGADLLKTSMFNEAITNYENLINFCSKTKGIKCPDDAHKNLAAARFGIFNSYLDVAKRAITGGRYTLAEVYILEAKAFQRKYKEDIIDDAQADGVAFNLSKAYITIADSSVKRKKFERALDYYYKAQKLCDSLTDYQCPTSIAQGINNAKSGLLIIMIKNAETLYENNNLNEAETSLYEAYNYFLNNMSGMPKCSAYDSLLYKIKLKQYFVLEKEAYYFTLSQQNELALSSIRKAKEIEKNFAILPSKKIDSILEATSKPLIRNYINIANTKTTLDEIDSALYFRDKSLNLINYSGLINDTSLSNNIKSLNEYIKNRLCFINKTNFEDLFTKAIQLANSNDYIYAVSYADSAINISKSKPECNIDTTEAVNLKNNYSNAMNYQLLIVKANDFYFKNIYDSSLYYYVNAQKFYYDKSISNSGLKHNDIPNYIFQKNNINYSMFSIEYFAIKGNFDFGLKLLDLLKTKGILNYELKQQQIVLGKYMAKADKIKEVKTKPRKNVKLYVSNNKWYKYFSNSYYKAWYNNKFYWVILKFF